MKKVNTIILSLAVSLAVSCVKEEKKEDPKPAIIKNNCTVIDRVVHYTSVNGQQLTETNEATLNANGKVEEVIYKTFPINNPGNVVNSYRITHAYKASGLLVQKNTYHLPDNKLLAFYTFEYNPDHLINKIKAYSILNNDTLLGRTDSLLYYADKRLKRDYTNPAVYFDYAYPGTGKVIKKEVFFNAATNQEVIQNLYEIDLDSKRANEEALYLYPFPNGTVAEFSNNIIAIKTTNYVLGFTNTTTYTYQYNLDDYPISWTAANSNNSNITTGTYNYNCQ